MSPAEEASTPMVVAADKLLEEGELIILAIKPSAWFVILASWPVLAVAMVLILLTASDTGVFTAGSIPQRAVQLLSLAAVTLRLGVACGQWVGRLYILTNVRVMRVRGLFHTSVVDCPLRKISGTQVAASRPERGLHVGSLTFDTGAANDLTWATIGQPDQVKDVIDTAITRAKGRS